MTIRSKTFSLFSAKSRNENQRKMSLAQFSRELRKTRG